MSEDSKQESSDKGSQPSQDAEPKVGLESLLARRDVIYENYDKPRETEPVQNSDKDSDVKESGSSKGEDVKEVSESDSSSDKEEKQEPKKEEKPQVPDGFVPKQALDEERSKRKQAVLKSRELEKKFEEKMKELEDKFQALSSKGSDTDEGQQEAERDPSVQKLTKEVQELRKQRQQEEAARQQQELMSKVRSTDEALEKDGFPGFDLATQRVQDEMVKLFNEGDLEREDLDDPKVWSKVYKEKVFPVVAKRFGVAKKSATLAEKSEAKKKAGLVGNPGKAPEAVSEEDQSPPSLDDLNKEYFKERRAAARKLLRG